MKLAIIVFCAVLATSSLAQTPTADGNWIKKGIDAFERVNTTRNGSNEDLLDSSALIYYVGGMVAVHRQNNLVTIIFLSAANKSNDPAAVPKLSPTDEARVQGMMALTPLRKLPDNLSSQQLIAVLRKHLDKYPERWGQPAAVLVANALEEAFAR